MANPLRDLFFGAVQNQSKKDLVEALTPRRTFDDVILPASTRRALDQALTQIKKHDLIFGSWGLAERHNTGLGLAFNFAGPPGTGKTVCAEAIAHSLNKKLLVVRYSEMESLWAGETGKNVASVFLSAVEQDAVLFFDEADAIAGRRFASVTQGYQREANTVVNVLLKELESFDGVVIFATNMAANFDPAFERRIRTHILFEMPDSATRARIWKAQLHARKTPLANDVDFGKLGAEFDHVSGGDIKNAVLKAAQSATAEPGPDNEKKIHQRHFEGGMRDVLDAKKVMDQSIYNDGDGSHRLSADSMSAMAGMQGAWHQLALNQETLQEEMSEVALKLHEIDGQMTSLPAIVERFDAAARHAQTQLKDELTSALEKSHLEYSNGLNAARENLASRLEPLERSREEIASQLMLFPQQIEAKTRLATDELRGELQARNAQLHAATQSLKLCLTLSVASLAAAIIAIVIAFTQH